MWARGGQWRNGGVYGKSVERVGKCVESKWRGEQCKCVNVYCHGV